MTDNERRARALFSAAWVLPSPVDAVAQIATELLDKQEMRVIELLDANNREVARRRQAEGGALEKPLLGCRTMGELLEAATILEALREEEGREIHIICDNPDFDSTPNAVVTVDWDWDKAGIRYSGDTILECLRNALAASKAADNG